MNRLPLLAAVIVIIAFVGTLTNAGPLQPAPVHAHDCGLAEWTVDSSQVPQTLIYTISAAGIATDYNVVANSDPAVAGITPQTSSGTDGTFSVTAKGFGAAGSNETLIEIGWAAPSVGESGLCSITVKITGPAPTTQPPPTPTPDPTPTPTATVAPEPTVTPLATVAPPTTPPAPTSASATPTATSTAIATPATTPTTAAASPTDSPSPSATRTAEDEPDEDDGTPSVGGGNDSRPDIVRSVPKASDLSSDLGVILTNLLFGGFTLVLMLLSAEIFNQTVEENEDDIKSWFGRISGPLKGLLGVIGDVGRLITDGRGVAGILAPIVLLALAALLYGLEEPGYGINEQSAVIFISFLAAFAVLTYVYDGGQLLMTNGFGIPGSIRLFPTGIFVALFCIALTRLLGFQPGIIFGFIAAHTLVAGSVITRNQEGRQILFPAIALLTICAAAFLLLGPARDLATDNDSLWASIPEGVAVGIFVAGLEGMFFQMVPIKFMDGHRLWAWSKLVWLGVTGVTAFFFWHILLNAERQSYDALSATTPAIALLLMGICFGATVAMYLFFRIKNARATSPA